MKARPILFSAPMIQALLAGSKSQTRRIMKPQPEIDGGSDAVGSPEWWLEWKDDEGYTPEELAKHCPYGKAGDLLYAKETWQLHTRAIDLAKIVYRASQSSSHTEFHRLVPTSLIGDMQPKPFQDGWRSSLFMPRWASRITLEIEEVRVERLQSISEEDAVAEGMASDGDEAAIISYSRLWEEINGKGSWAENPFVWCISFKVHRCNVDTLLKERGA